MPVALITGATTGIGRELAQIAALNNYDLILTARTPQSLQTAAADIERTTARKTHIFPTDLSQPNAARTLFADITQAGLTIDVLINNAGFGLLGKFAELPEDEQMQMIQLNIGALTQLTRLALPGMIERRTGYVLNVASTASFQPGPLMAIYYASKAYVLSFSEAIHNEAKGTGVNVCCLCPGATRTEFQQRAGMAGTKLFEGAARHERARSSPNRLERHEARQAPRSGRTHERRPLLPDPIRAPPNGRGHRKITTGKKVSIVEVKTRFAAFS